MNDSEQVRMDSGDGPQVQVVLSDMAPKTTGIRDADQVRSIGLVEHALYFCEDISVPEGIFMAKVFQGRSSMSLFSSFVRLSRRRQ